MLLSLEGVSAEYGGVIALSDITLEVREGDFIAIIGPNGAGKTTLMATISGLLPASSGRIQFGGADITLLPAYRRVLSGIVLCPEGRRLFADMTVEDNLLAGAYRVRDRREVRRRLAEIEKLFPVLVDRRRQTARTLSGGEQQMVAIGRALMSGPKLLLLDEPSLGLAPIVVSQLFATLRAIHAAGVTIVLVEQNVRQSLETAATAQVLENGRLRLSGSAAALLRDPYITSAYLGIE